MNKRRTKKFLAEVFGDPSFTLHQKVVMRKTWSVFTVNDIAKHFKAQRSL
jgi:hypothetical protein